MKRAVYKAVILTVGVVIMLIAGCSEQNTSKSEVRKSRLIAAQLKKQSEQLSKEVEEQKELLAKCLEEKKIAEEQSQPQKSDKDRMDSLLTTVMEQGAKLREENEKLKTEIMELKGKKTGKHKGPSRRTD
jgi:small-conductance mechanosensitive channel